MKAIERDVDNHYRIMGRSPGIPVEEIDSSDTLANARYLLREYRIAFGRQWTVWIEEQTFDDTGTLDACTALED